ncbi:transcriptional regulator CBF1 [Microdochium nivale]|nr:transcriptional regulator CBF1 [Microdochium nivale]
MPRPAMPLTPGSSSEIKGQDNSKDLPHLHMAFELPPSAIPGSNSGSRTTQPSADSADPTSPSSVSPKAPYPVQPSEAVKARRRSSTAQQHKETFALPPPPTRSRKIIQMKPQVQAQAEPGEMAASAKTKASGPTIVTKNTAPEPGSKKKQPSTTSAAGRKIARKTAHSLIERRRRSKMNEEFGVLKDLIPACTGDMHKLAILQASIEYVRYLEDCVATLKTQCDTQASLPAPADFRPSAPMDRDQFDEEEEEEDVPEVEVQEDVEMTGASSTPLSTTNNTSSRSPTFLQYDTARSRQPSVSPALVAQDARQRQQSYSSISTADRRHYSVSSSLTSPMFRGQGAGQDYAASIGSFSHSALTSPALMPQQEDHEATAALLMLNADRRGTSFSTNTARGMSVRDLLSS